MKHVMRLHPQPFKAIAAGKKRYEFRLNDEKRRMLRVDDEIEFENRENTYDRIRVVVEELRVYPSFAAIYDALPQTDREEQTLEDWISKLRAYYSEAEERSYGTVAIRFSVK